MKVETINGFFDKEANEPRLAGNVFDCSEERAKELSDKGFVEMLEKTENKPSGSKKAKK